MPQMVEAVERIEEVLDPRGCEETSENVEEENPQTSEQLEAEHVSERHDAQSTDVKVPIEEGGILENGLRFIRLLVDPCRAQQRACWRETRVLLLHNPKDSSSKPGPLPLLAPPHGSPRMRNHDFQLRL